MARYRRFDTTRAGVSTVDAVAPPDVIESVRSRRAGLRSAIGTLERALAAPAPHRVEEWRTGVSEALTEMHEVWTRHIIETEAPGAFLDDLVEEAPRLSTPAARLRREHNEILGVITRAEKMLGQVLLDDDHEVYVDALRADLTEMLCALAHHRQRGADLIFAAYDVDIGGG
jgi:hypothetical protein